MSILCYHSVEPEWRSALAVTPEAFAAQCAWLAKHRQVVPLERAVDLLDSSYRLPSGVAALTFDDGFAELYTHALPSLLRYGFSATIFLVAETLTPGGRIVDWVDTPPRWPLRTLTIDQVLEMQERGVKFGSHSWAHRDLTTLSEAECVRDLRASRDLLEALVRQRISFLAYPRGLHHAHVRRAAERAGYERSFSLPEGPEPVGPHAVPRVGIYGGNGFITLAVKSSRWYLGMHRSGLSPVARAVVRRHKLLARPVTRLTRRR